MAEICRTEKCIEGEEREVKKLGDKLKQLYETFEKTIEPKDERSARDAKYQKYMRFLAMVINGRMLSKVVHVFVHTSPVMKISF